MVSMQVAALALVLSGVGQTVLLDFTAPWCAPCRSMEGTVDELKHAGYPVREVNIDRERNLAVRYHVESIPCFVLLVDGKEAGRLTGASRRDELLTLFAKAGVGRNGTRTEIARAQSPDEPMAPVAVPRQPDDGPLPRSRLSLTNGGGAVADRQQASPPNGQELIASSVRLTIQDAKGYSYGSGTIIDAQNGEALVLTCGHIFRDSQGKGAISVDLFGPQAPQKIAGRVVAFDLKSDLGLVSIRPGVPVIVAPVARRGYQMSKGDKVTTVGCNNGGPATAIASEITAVDKFLGPPNVQVAGLPVQGRSGGGLFNAQGEVIGVCNAADPADNEGLYAALPAIQAQLDQSGLTAVYERQAGPGSPAMLASDNRAADPRGADPRGMDPRGTDRGVDPRNVDPRSLDPRVDPRAAAGLAAANVPTGALNDNERAALAEMRKQGEGAEVICIVRSLENPQAKSQVIMLDRASSAFLKQLATDREVQEARHLTSLNVARGNQVPARPAAGSYAR